MCRKQLNGNVGGTRTVLFKILDKKCMSTSTLAWAGSTSESAGQEPVPVTMRVYTVYVICPLVGTECYMLAHGHVPLER